MPFTATETPLNRFWGYVARGAEDECWLWRGPCMAFGHGYFKIGRRRMLAHRYSMTLHTGEPIPTGKFVCHHCDNPPCVNPAHLYVGTARDNARDMILRGRSKLGSGYARTPGDAHPNARLTADKVLAARKRHVAGERLVDLAREYGVGKGTMHHALHGITWRNL